VVGHAAAGHANGLAGDDQIGVADEIAVLGIDFHVLVRIAKVHARDEAQGVSLLDSVTVLPAARGRRAGRLARGRAVTGRRRRAGRRAAATAAAAARLAGARLAGARLAGLGTGLGARLGARLGAAGLLGSKLDLVQETRGLDLAKQALALAQQTAPLGRLGRAGRLLLRSSLLLLLNRTTLLLLNRTTLLLLDRATLLVERASLLNDASSNASSEASGKGSSNAARDGTSNLEHLELAAQLGVGLLSHLNAADQRCNDSSVGASGASANNGSVGGLAEAAANVSASNGHATLKSGTDNGVSANRHDLGSDGRKLSGKLALNDGFLGLFGLLASETELGKSALGNLDAELASLELEQSASLLKTKANQQRNKTKQQQINEKKSKPCGSCWQWQLP
jgi:hypothetical protein